MDLVSGSNDALSHARKLASSRIDNRHRPDVRPIVPEFLDDPPNINRFHNLRSRENKLCCSENNQLLTLSNIQPSIAIHYASAPSDRVQVASGPSPLKPLLCGSMPFGVVSCCSKPAFALKMEPSWPFLYSRLHGSFAA